MAAANITLLSILQLLVAASAKIPKAWELLMLLYDLFEAEIDTLFGGPTGGGLEVIELSPEEERLAGQISERLSADGTQRQLDLTKLRKLIRFANEFRNGEIGKLLIAVLMGLASGS